MNIKAAAARMFSRRRLMGVGTALALGAAGFGLAGCEVAGPMLSGVGLIGDPTLDARFQGVCFLANQRGGIYRDKDGVYLVNPFITVPYGNHDYANVQGVIRNGRVFFSGTYRTLPTNLVGPYSTLGGTLNGPPVILGSGQLDIPSEWALKARYIFPVGNKAIGDAVVGGNPGHRPCGRQEVEQFNPGYARRFPFMIPGF